MLYAALEDNPRRLQNRMQRLLPQQEWPERLTFWTQCPRLDQGGVDAIRRWIEAAPNPRLAIIDTLARVRGSRSDSDSVYEGDYRALEALHALANEKSVAIVLVHHVRKMDADDPLDTVSGTTGLTGAADSVLILRREAHGVTLHGRGRDMPEIEVAVRFDPERCLWSVLGEVEEVRRSDQRNAILDAMREIGRPASPAEIRAATGMEKNNLDRLLFKMVRDGQVDKLGTARYTLPLGGGKSGKPVSQPKYSCYYNDLGESGDLPPDSEAVSFNAYRRAKEGL